MMYDELVKRLREVEEMLKVVQFKEATNLINQAADAIEELSEPRWIPVTERLPEETGKYLVCGQWSGKPAETWVCELIAFGQIKGWANEARNPVVTYWMPLPEPPKDGET